MLTIGTSANPISITMAPAFMGEVIKLKNMFDVVKPTPNIKHAQIEALDVPFQYRLYRNGARKAPARAPQEIPIS